MSLIDKQVMHDFVDGTIVVEQMLDLNFELLRNANNDTFQRLIKTLAIQSEGGDVKATQLLESVMNALTFKEGHGITMTLEKGNVLKVAIVNGGVTTDSIANQNITTEKIKDLNITTVKLAAESVTKEKVKKGELTLAELNTSDVDTRYTTKDETNEVISIVNTKASHEDVYSKDAVYTKGEVEGLMSIENSVNVDGGNFLDIPSLRIPTIDGGTF